MLPRWLLITVIVWVLLTVALTLLVTLVRHQEMTP
jgi:hypothetical protein